jgi:two-component system, response regulator
MNPASGPLDILLVDDSHTDAELTLRALRKAGLAAHVLWVTDGQAALDYLFAEGAYRGAHVARPRLVLLDLKLPKLSGLDVLRRLKADAARRSIPVVLLTSSTEERDLLQAYELGVNSYLVKPVDYGALDEVVVRAGKYWLLSNRIPQ